MDFLYENKYKLIYEALKIILIIAIIIIQLNQRKYITSFEKNYEENILLENTDEIINNNEIYQRKHVDIKGAVEKPGVYEVNNEMLIYDVIENAGGLKKDAYTDNLNLSKKVTDEMVIYIYTKKEAEKFSSEICSSNKEDITNCLNQKSSIIISSNKTSNSNNTPTKININNANKNELTKLNNIGNSKAQAIIDYRTQNGPFKKIEDIMNVTGIGESIYQKIKDYITI